MKEKDIETKIKALINLYLREVPITKDESGNVTWAPLEKYQDFTSCVDKGERLMRYYSGQNVDSIVGNKHFWYLKFHPSAQKKAQEILNTTRPWEHINEPRFTCFEDWYAFVQESLSGIPYIKNIVWYDIALILAYVMNQPLMPDDRVYIHAKPQRIAKVLLPVLSVSEGTIRGMNRNKYIAINDIQIYFQKLTAYQVEDFLCWLGQKCKGVPDASKSSEKLNINIILNKTTNSI
ncbi:MAG: hypothetical protein HUK02_07275 [Bacteroidaceae bacterium]|nr:hypothetical protein [Bacteroidaceae bacterium]